MGDSVILEVTVVPRSSRFAIRSKEGRLKVYLRSAPESNKANLELIKEMKKLLKADVRIVSGKTSRKKVLEIDLPEEDLKNVLPIK